MIYDELTNMLKVAMISKKENVKNYIRAIKSKITEHCVASNLNRNEKPNDELVIKVISAHKKSLEKAIKQLERGGDKSINLIAEYKDEISFCEQFLPNEEKVINEIEKVVDEAIRQIGNNTGKVMGYVMKNYNYDGKLVKSVVIRKVNK